MRKDENIDIVNTQADKFKNKDIANSAPTKNVLKYRSSGTFLVKKYCFQNSDNYRDYTTVIL